MPKRQLIELPSIAEPREFNVRFEVVMTASGRWLVPSIAIAAVGTMVLLCCCGAPLLLPAVQAAREAARRAQCMNNLRAIGIALHKYHDTYGCFPPAYLADASGRPIHSWRVLLLPFLDTDLTRQYDFSEPWDSPKNRRLADRVPAVYQCPGDPEASRRFTSYVGSEGPGRFFQAARPVTEAEIKDGTAYTIAVIESSGPGIVWTAPRDRPTIASGPTNHPHHPGGKCALFADGSARFLADSIDPRAFEELVLIDDGGTPIPKE